MTVNKHCERCAELERQLSNMKQDLECAQTNFRVTNQAYCKLDVETRELRGERFAPPPLDKYSNIEHKVERELTQSSTAATWPQPDQEGALSGWSIDFKFLTAVSKKTEEICGEEHNQETIEAVLLAAKQLHVAPSATPDIFKAALRDIVAPFDLLNPNLTPRPAEVVMLEVAEAIKKHSAIVALIAPSVGSGVEP